MHWTNQGKFLTSASLNYNYYFLLSALKFIQQLFIMRPEAPFPISVRSNSFDHKRFVSRAHYYHHFFLFCLNTRECSQNAIVYIKIRLYSCQINSEEENSKLPARNRTQYLCSFSALVKFSDWNSFRTRFIPIHSEICPKPIQTHLSQI